jgi:hypothetical protein
VVTSFAEQAAPHGNLPRQNKIGCTDGSCARHIAACRAYPLSSGTPLRCVFFERVAIAFEHLTEGFDPAWQWFSVNGLHALSNLRKGQRTDLRRLKGRGGHCVGQRRRTATAVATHQPTHTADAPCVRLVANTLCAHTKLLGNHLGLDPAPDQQPSRCSRASVTMTVIDRKLLQRYFLEFVQLYNTLHPLPRHQEGARLARFKQIFQKHSDGVCPSEVRGLCKKAAILESCHRNDMGYNQAQIDHTHL